MGGVNPKVSRPTYRPRTQPTGCRPGWLRFHPRWITDSELWAEAMREVEIVTGERQSKELPERFIPELV